jgi:hypothetical protein
MTLDELSQQIRQKFVSTLGTSTKFEFSPERAEGGFVSRHRGTKSYVAQEDSLRTPENTHLGYQFTVTIVAAVDNNSREVTSYEVLTWEGHYYF